MLRRGQGKGASVAPGGGNIRKVYLYQGFTNFSLFMPVWILFLRDERHLSLTQITVMMGLSWLLMAGAEVPAGALADAVGRRITLLIGTATVATGIAVMALVPAYWGVMAGYLVWSAGMALQSGTDMAMQYDSLKADGREQEYKSVAGRSYAIIQFSQGVASVAGGVVAAWSLALPLLLSSLMTVVGLGFVLATREPPREAADRKPYVATLRAAGSFVRREPDIRYLLVFSALISSSAWIVVFLLFQPYVSEHRLSVGWIGVLFLVLRLAGVAGSRFGSVLASGRALPASLYAGPALFTLGLAVLAMAEQWWIGFGSMLLIGFVQGSLRPVLSDQLNQRVSSATRATLLSLQGLLLTLMTAALQPLLGSSIDRWGMTASFLLLGLVTLSAMPLRVLWRRSEPRPASDSVPVVTRAG
ncbi:MFS transporter [Actinomadura sp. 3N407]|uniref:MFS transporter n=1 Tax=Actinomadura sp. 3N407 TaxID=3457423 RepID=UPI003FCC45E7